jgi:hypothetical protein
LKRHKDCLYNPLNTANNIDTNADPDVKNSLKQCKHCHLFGHQQQRHSACLKNLNRISTIILPEQSTTEPAISPQIIPIILENIEIEPVINQVIY